MLILNKTPLPYANPISVKFAAMITLIASMMSNVLNAKNNATN